jgi:trk system potassium uptake protein TrkA
MAIQADNVSRNESKKIVILGCGRVGSTLAKQMSSEGHDVTVLDQTSDSFRRLGTKFKGQRLVGSGLDQDLLNRAHLSKADIFIAVTQGDNTNIMAAQIAREVFSIRSVIARIYDPIRAQAYREMGITTFCTTTLAAGLIHDAALGGATGGVLQQAAQGWDALYLEQRG